MNMCCSASSIRSWFHEPIAPSKEACRLGIFTAVALLAIGIATYSYFYGTPAAYGKIYAYGLWGITGGAVLGTLISYAARAILSRKHQQAPKRYDVFEKFFPGASLDNLPDFSTNLIGRTGYFDQHQALDFKDGPVIRGRQAGKPFIGIRLAIQDDEGSKTSATLLIAPNPYGSWYFHTSNPIIPPLTNDGNPESRFFTDWVLGILNGRERFLLQTDPNFTLDSRRSNLIERPDGPKVSLWRD